jgi:hypothetical protein
MPLTDLLPAVQVLHNLNRILVNSLRLGYIRMQVRLSHFISGYVLIKLLG